MTNSRGPSDGEPAEWDLPPTPPGPPTRGAPPRRQPPMPPSQEQTRHIRQPGRAQDPAIRDAPRPQQPGPPNRPPQQPIPPQGRPPQQPGLPPNPQPRQPGPPPPYEHTTTTRISTPPPLPDAPVTAKPGRSVNRTAMLLILAIVLLLV